jgi:hypothetical protein
MDHSLFPSHSDRQRSAESDQLDFISKASSTIPLLLGGREPVELCLGQVGAGPNRRWLPVGRFEAVLGQGTGVIPAVQHHQAGIALHLKSVSWEVC